MSIASEITRIKNNISSAYNKLEELGAVLPHEKNSNNLSGAISTIAGGEYNIDQVIVDDGCELHITDNNKTNLFHCVAIDYDGTILKEVWCSSGEEFELPAFPIHDKLIAQEWSASSPIVNNKIIADKDVLAGVVYTTKSGLTELDIEVTKALGKTIFCSIQGSKNWGDGTSDNLMQHTYSDYGIYTITSNATEIVSSVTSMPIVGGADGYPSYLINLRIGSNVIRIGDLIWVSTLKTCTIPNSVKTIRSNQDFMKGVYCIGSVILPHSISECNEPIISKSTVVIPYGMTEISSIGCADTVIPDSVINIEALTTGSNIFHIPNSVKYINSLTINSEKLILPSGLEGLNSLSAPNIKNLILPSGITEITSISASSLKSIIFPSNLVALGTSSKGISGFAVESISFPSSLTFLGKISSFSELKEFVVPGNITRFTANMFSGCTKLKKVIFHENFLSLKGLDLSGNDNSIIFDFSKCKQICTLDSGITGINILSKIIVPDNLYDTWITSSRWSSYANYIYKASEGWL